MARKRQKSLTSPRPFYKTKQLKSGKTRVYQKKPGKGWKVYQ